MKKIVDYYDKDIEIVTNCKIILNLLMSVLTVIDLIVFINIVPKVSLEIFFILSISLVIFIAFECCILFKLSNFISNKCINADEFMGNDIFRYDNYYTTRLWYLEKTNNFVTLNPTQKYEHQYFLCLGNQSLEISEEQYDILISENQTPQKPLLILIAQEYNKLFSDQKIDFLEVGTL